MKENRIYCIEVSGECQHFMDTNSPLRGYLCECPQGFYCNKDIAWKPITKDACKNCKEGKYQGFTREQAIYKMAKALCNMYYSACSECAFKDNPKECKSLLKNSDFYEQGEAVLDALLEGHNDER